ncbi:hypothetical protein JMN32_24935 [Fulvivirga sp. 29W222]|uniref:Uncharacterized protein n=1 Tax=Fulvivirga marina TaxID=2494733 RepID=A0A937G407_9BACT|nr:hypothetical protein [Fulvivirga marina]MBL6449580.1 hypothetical protein [Fulvivirga marina]
MSNSIITNPGTVGAGDIQFFDSIQPPLKTDDYTLKAKQTIENVVDSGDDPKYEAIKKLTIDGPRFVLKPSSIHSLFPPANQEGNYANFLPNIVFSDFSLPWSRAIDPDQTTENEDTPWMGLLTLYEAEYKETSSTRKISTPQTVSTSELVNPGEGILPPNLGAGFTGNEDDKVTVVDIDLKYFQAIAPKLEELRYLSHARAVNTDGKVILNMDADGCFSLCIGNRVPGAGQKNMALLVSFEGHQDHLNGATITGNYTKIRLVHLGSWEFTATVFDKEFLNMMEALCLPGNGGSSLIQMSINQATEQNATAKEALKIGYVALQNQMRVGENATSWYRGPLVPSPTKRESSQPQSNGNYGPYIYSDHAMHYDPETGIFNHAYSAAWQIGRLLALSDASFAQGIFNWRADYLKSIVNQAKQKKTLAAAASIQVADIGPSPLNLHSATRSFFTDAFKKVDWDKLKTRKQKMLIDRFPGIFTDEEKKTIEENDEDPLLTLHQKIKQ